MIKREGLLCCAVLTTVAGACGSTGSTDGTGIGARFAAPDACVVDPTGQFVFIAEAGGTSYKIRKIVIATGVVTTLAGSGIAGGLDGTGTNATLRKPRGIVMDPTGLSLYVSDYTGHLIRKIVIDTRIVTTVAGAYATSGDANGSVGSACRLNSPQHLAIDPKGESIYVTDLNNRKVRRIQ